MVDDVLFRPLQLGAITLGNRIVMAPMTRMRSGPGHAPTSLTAEYYSQRASAGLIITEGSAVSAQGQGYPNAPGIYTDAQIAGWRSVVDGVHAAGGKIVMQIAHNGRNSHSSLLPDHVLPVAPSAVPAEIPALTADSSKCRRRSHVRWTAVSCVASSPRFGRQPRTRSRPVSTGWSSRARMVI